MSESAAQDDHAYFQAIEETFIRLRGAPLLLSPADWRVSQSWHRAGIPLGLVQETLETLFKQREERGAKGRVQSLRYCREAVESAWEELQELQAPARREAAEGLDVAARLVELAKEVPDLAELSRLDLPSRIETLEGSTTEVESGLSSIESEVYAALRESLDEEQRRELDARITEVLAALPEPPTGDERARAGERLERQILRRRFGVPYLTLFS